MDGRLRPRPDDLFRRRRHPCAGAFARDRRCRSSGVELRLIARNNEVLATKTTGADGRVDFDPGLSRGTGGSAPGLLVGDARRRLRLPQSRPAGLRPHRPRRLRPRRAERARRLRLHRARRLSLGRDGVRRRAAARRNERGQDRPAADAGRQAPRRRRIQAPDRRRPGPRRPRRSPCRCSPTRRRANGRSTPTPIPRGRASATPNSCSRTMCPSGSISR